MDCIHEWTVKTGMLIQNIMKYFWSNEEFRDSCELHASPSSSPGEHVTSAVIVVVFQLVLIMRHNLDKAVVNCMGNEGPCHISHIGRRGGGGGLVIESNSICTIACTSHSMCMSLSAKMTPHFSYFVSCRTNRNRSSTQLRVYLHCCAVRV